MELRQITAVYFSPTGVTDKVVRTLAEALAEELGLPLTCRSFTRPGERREVLRFSGEELAVVGTPTYAGRVPNKLAPDLRDKLRGEGTPAVAAVTFGNRAYDNSLAELCALLEETGFLTLAAGAFPGRHAFTDALGEGRPDWDDKRAVREFAGRIAGKIRVLEEAPPPVEVPGDPEAPYYIPKGLDGEPAKFLKAKPRTDLGKCCNCGVCARACPMGAINPENVAEVPGTCIKCQSCVRKCTHRAKYFDDPAFRSHVAMLERNFPEPKKIETFL